VPSRNHALTRIRPGTLRSLLATGLVAGWMPVGVMAQEPTVAPSAAEIDWRPRSELPPEVQERLPAFCEGGYLPPQTGQGPDAASTSDTPLEASSLNARYELDSQLYLQGDVQLRQGNFQASGTEARYNQQTGEVRLQGPLVSRGEGVLLTGQEARYSVDSGRFDVNSATFLFHEAELRGTASSLSRVSENQVLITDGLLTTCGPQQNDWALVASDIELDRAEGFGTAKHIRLEVLDTPVFYWPYMTFPIDDRRKTGFLYPQFGSSNAGGGAFLATPYYLNLAPNYDATITPQYIHGRGLFTELEGRYLSSLGQSVLQLGYINNDSAYEDEFPGEDGERWGLDFTSRAGFGGGWNGYVDYSAVSDQDYLNDLNRSLDISQTTHLRRQAGVRYSGNDQYFGAYLNGYQTLDEGVNPENKPYDQLPEIIYGGTLDAGPFEALLESQYTWFDRNNDTLTGLEAATGQRLRIIPEVALPMRTLWGYSRPSVSLDYTRYELDDYDYNQRDGSFDRSVPVFEWDNGLYFDRRGELFEVPYNQTLEPRVYYAWADADDQSYIPDFDTGLRSFRFDQLFERNRFAGGDRVGDTNQLTVALTSRFNDLRTGAERARISVGQVHYFDDWDVTLNGHCGMADCSDTDSPLAGEVALNPLDNLEIRSSGLWDPESSQTLEGRSQLTFHSDDYRYLATLGHTYRRDDPASASDDSLEQSDIGTVFPITDRVSAIGRWVYDSSDDRTAGSLAGIEYNNCCWSVQLVHQNYLTSDEKLDSRILFRVELKGLGGSGGATEDLSRAIYGYDERERRRFGAPPR